MRKYVGYLFVILITGSIIGQVTVQGSYAMAMDDSNPYEEFWKILYREAELVVKVENGNISAIQELIENSRKGEENAANISSLTWTSLKELESSGVKMYYTEEELRKMAEDIAENGLPEDTVRALKEQGWSDQEIKALEDYIAKNKDNITGDFNMSEFLMNFSRAFVKVGFKYAEYESWALEKWKWEGKANFTGSLPSNEGLNPFLINELSDVRLAYSTNNMKGLLKAINELSSKMYEIFKYEMVEYSSLPSRFGQLKNRGYVTFYKGGFVVITTRNIRYFPNYTEEVTEYYWPTALKAYNLTRQIYVIVKAISMGNGDQELRKMLKDKMEELREALVVYINKYERKPWRDLILLRSSPVTRGRLIISKEVVIDEATPDEVKYRIKITMEAHNNDVRDIEIEVDDTTSGSSDKGSVDYLTMGESKTWFSKQFSIKPSDTTVKIEGKIKITYTPVCGDIPQRSGQSLDECTEPRTISDEYSKVIEVTDSIDPSKVTFNIIASKKKIREGDSVDFYIEVTNDNNIKIEGKYLLEVSVPQGRSSTPYPKKFHGNVSVDPGSTKTIKVATVSYSKSGTYSYSGSFSFGQGYSKTDSGEIVVARRDTGTTGSLKIAGLTYIPKNPREGEFISFIVNVTNSYSSSQKAKVILYIDKEKIGEASGEVGVNSWSTFKLKWKAKGGKHYYRVVIYRVNGDAEEYEDGETGELEVASLDQQFAVSLDVFPAELEGGGRVFFTVGLRNFDYNAIPVRGFVVDEDGAIIKNIEDRIPAKGVKNITFSYLVYGVGNHTFKLFLDNYDGEANGKGEEHWSKATIEVKPVGDVVASMSCYPTTVPLDSSTTCTVSFELKSPATVTLNLEEVDFGGKRVWPEGPSSVIVKEKTITLTPTNMQDDLTITITINDELANYYFGERPWLSTGSYKDRLVGYSYLVKAEFNESITITDAITVSSGDSSTIEDLETAVKVTGVGVSALEEVASHAGQLEIVASGMLGKVARVGSKFLGFVGS